MFPLQVPSRVFAILSSSQLVRVNSVVIIANA